MRITIEGRDYTSAVDMDNPLTIERKLNQPSVCAFRLTLQRDSELAWPERNQRIAVNGDDGTVYFTGYIASAPSPELAGDGVEGLVYRLGIVARSEEALLDQVPLSVGSDIPGTTAGSFLTSLLTHLGSSALQVTGSAADTPISYVAGHPGARWTARVQEAMMMARVTYRALNGSLAIMPIGSEFLRITEDEQGITPRGLEIVPCLDHVPVNDVVLCGALEPVAYVTEYFRGDGVTADYYLSAEPFTSSVSNAVIVRELFDGPDIDARKWANGGQSGYFSAGASGLSISGGTGIDGETVLSWLDPVEMGGTLLMEATGVTLSAGSNGILAGFFDGGSASANCSVGFSATMDQTSGNVMLQPIIGGSLAGTAFISKASNQYTLRARVHCPEVCRVHAIYRGSTDDGAVTAGGDWIPSPGEIQLEVEEFVNGVGGMPVTLYEGAIASLPATCSVIAVSSQSLSGSMRSFQLARLGTGWVVSEAPGGAAYARRLGTPAQGGDCQVLSGGRLHFQTGFTPVAGELIAVSYRTTGRAVGRAADLEDQQALSAAGKTAVAAWVGSVIEPPARSSTDCRNAAFVTAETSASESSVLQGTYRGTSEELECDVWPGDALALELPSAGLNARVIVREAKLSYTASVPDSIQYQIRFANDWARDLSIRRDSTVPADALLEVSPAPTVLPNLGGLAVASMTANTVTIDAGTIPPSGGGFEVRRRDFDFSAGNDPGLVTRSTQRNFTIARETPNDRFYVRMFDNAAPPNYSEFSAALIFNLPLDS